jgi:hypothetical protein
MEAAMKSSMPRPIESGDQSLIERYTRLLRDYLKNGSESALEQGYEMARNALKEVAASPSWRTFIINRCEGSAGTALLRMRCWSGPAVFWPKACRPTR